MNRKVIVLLMLALTVGLGPQATVSLGGYVDYVGSLNPNIYYRMDEDPIAANTTLAVNQGIDGMAGNGRYNVYYSAPAISTGPSGGAVAGDAGVLLQGLGAQVLNGSTDLASGKTPFSVSFWAKPTQAFAVGDNAKMFNYGDAGDPNGTSLLIGEDGEGGTGKVAIGAYYQPLFTSQGAMTLGQWNSIGLTYDGTQMRLFINGQFDSAYSGAGLPASGFKNVNNWFGGLYTDGGDPFIGGLDEFAYWRGTSLSDAQMQNLGNAAIPEPSVMVLVATGLVGLLAYAWRKRK